MTLRDYAATDRSSDYIAHHGILGQKWGIRRYQNPDGTLTKAGMKHYRKAEKALERETRRKRRKIIRRAAVLGLGIHTVMYIKDPNYRKCVNIGIQKTRQFASDVIKSDIVQRTMQRFK